MLLLCEEPVSSKGTRGSVFKAGYWGMVSNRLETRNSA